MQDVTINTDRAADLAAQLQRQVAALATANAGEARAAPRTPRELEALRQERNELGGQLVAAHARRGTLASELQHADAGARAGLMQQLAVLDRRIVQLETDMSGIVHAMATAPASALAGADAPPPPPPAPRLPSTGTTQPRGLVLLGPNGPSLNAIPVLLFLVLALQVILLRRGRGRRRDASADGATLRDAAARLARVEQAVDAIAVEVERVSEGQRFVSRLLNDRPPASAIPPAPPPRQYATPN